MKKLLVVLAIGLLLAGCTKLTNPYGKLETKPAPTKEIYQETNPPKEIVEKLPEVDLTAISSVFQDYNLVVPNGNRMRVCSAHDCTNQTPVRVPVAALQEARGALRLVFTAEGERQALGKAMGLIETHIGKMTGTDRDRAGYNSWIEPGNPSQMDDTDEAMNSTQYLMIMYKYGLVRHNRLLGPKLYKGKWVVVFQDVKTNKLFALDSSVGDNGAPAEISVIE